MTKQAMSYHIMEFYVICHGMPNSHMHIEVFIRMTMIPGIKL